MRLSPDWTPLGAVISDLESVVAKLQGSYREATTTPFILDRSTLDYDRLTYWDEPSGSIADWSNLLAEYCARGWAEVRASRAPGGELETVVLAVEDWRNARFTREGRLVHPLLPTPWHDVEVRARTASPEEQPASDDIVTRARAEADDATLSQLQRRTALYFAAWSADGFPPTHTAKEANLRAGKHYPNHPMLNDDRRRQQEAWLEAKNRPRS
jgi:hypothetical protein